MEYLEELKQRSDIVHVAGLLNCCPPQRNRTLYQGSCCPSGHESESGKCFSIWPEVQAFKCFHCSAKGDVIELVKLALGVVSSKLSIGSQSIAECPASLPGT